ncbi:hypothetical protein [Almyronema epifaneia]|uniref:Uncharacterized protein n=1 Tax=Almyronema epifaneia S1 TaxID=2991925 RepID=A0ABW6IF24_9CYAN
MKRQNGWTSQQLAHFSQDFANAFYPGSDRTPSPQQQRGWNSEKLCALGEILAQAYGLGF